MSFQSYSFESPKRRKSKTKVWAIALAATVGLGTLAAIMLTPYLESQEQRIEREKSVQIKKTHEARTTFTTSLAEQWKHNSFPETFETEWNGSKQKIRVEYSIDQRLQAEAVSLLKSYKPDYGAILAIDPFSGRILSMASFSKHPEYENTNLTLVNTFPAASIFKIVTATAAVEKYNLSPDTLIFFNGSNTSLFKKNVLQHKSNRWTREMTLKDAFARSVNTAFARIGVDQIQPKDLEEYAHRFGFNQNVATDLPLAPSFADIPTERSFELGETASGYTRVTTMSPVHGAMIASTVASNGKMPVPYLIQKAVNEKGEVLFESQPMTAAEPLAAVTASRLKELMEQTIIGGTGRKSFRSLLHDRKFKSLEMGGKTGSLTGTNPKGKTDWFVGYAVGDGHGIAVAAVTVNVKNWTVKSSYLAQRMFRSKFKNEYLTQGR